MNEQNPSTVWTDGHAHWVDRSGDADGDVRLFLWEKPRREGTAYAGTILFVHGSSMASQPTFDLHVPGRADSSAMAWFAERGFDTWTMDNEGYGRSSKHRDINSDIANGADDLKAGSAYILERADAAARRDGLLVYGISSGALKAALFAERCPERVSRLVLDAFVWTGDGSPTLKERAKKLPEFRAMNRRPIDRAFVRSIFTRDHPGCAEERVVEAFADAILLLDDSMPTGTYVDMCSKLPVVAPERIQAAVLVLRGEYDGIASLDDLIRFFVALPNMDKQFNVMRGISHASFQQKNHQLVYHLMHGFFTRPDLPYRGA